MSAAVGEGAVDVVVAAVARMVSVGGASAVNVGADAVVVGGAVARATARGALNPSPRTPRTGEGAEGP